MEKAESLWRQYEDTSLVTRCEDYALWTNPTIFPKHWMSPKKGNANLPVEHDYQSIGALLVKSASTKITSILFPVRQPFFRIGLNAKVKADLKEAAKANAQELDDKGLQAFASDIEQNACAQMFKNASYSALQRFLALLLITGNALIYRNNKQEMLVYSLHNYVVKRDGAGTVLAIVLREFLAFNSLAPDIQAEINKSGRYKANDEVILYTAVERQQDSKGTVTYTARQEIEGRSVGKPEEYPEKLCPFIPVYWSLANGEIFAKSPANSAT